MFNDDSYPTVDELNDYVAIGPSKDLSISIDKTTFDSAFIITSIILFIVFICIIVTLLILNNNLTYSPIVYKQATFKEPTQLTVNDDYGSSKNGYSHNLYKKKTPDGTNLTKETCVFSNSKWNDTTNNCSCPSGKYGPNCDFEFHDANYIAVGNINPCDIKSEVIGTYKTKYKSFKNTKPSNELSSNHLGIANYNDILDESCSEKCDKNFTCDGFFYKTNKCILYKNNINIPDISKLKYSITADSTLYAKSLEHIKFDNQIFLSESEFSLPTKYWLFKNTNTFAKIQPNIVSRIKFIPRYIKYNYNYIGIYSSYEFQYKDIENILIENNSNYNNNSNFYMHFPYDEFAIPHELLRDDSFILYVIYITFKF